MMHRSRSARYAAVTVVSALSLMFASAGFPLQAEDAPESSIRPDARLTFERDVRPIFKAYCFDCHGATEELKGELDLRLRRFLVRGGASGAALLPGQPAESYLLQRIENGEMPPGEKKVPADQVATLRQWIADGAPTAREEPERLDVGVRITPEERAFWSFQPIQRPDVEKLAVWREDGTAPQAAMQRIRTPIDALLLERMAPRGLSFSPDADRLTLLRRATFDLLGLPPTPDQIERFLADRSPDAYQRLLDRLLDSPHYGERWGRHWLDVAGYADTEGYTNTDAARPWAYKYRDYVINSFNQDKPLDQFIVEQLAGDELVPPPHRNLTPRQIEQLTATGFLRMAADGTGSGANNETARNQAIADTIKILSSSLLGLSVGCAQCHDHRYDPILQEDYYQLRAILAPALDWQRWRTPQQRQVSLYTDEDRQRAAEVEAEAQKLVEEKAAKQKVYIEEALAKELQKFEEPLREQLRAAYDTPADKRSEEQNGLLKKHPSVNITAGTLYQYNQAAADDLKKFDQRIAEIRQRKPVEEFVRALTEVPGQIPATHVFHRGEFQQPTREVTPAALRITAAPGERLEVPADDPGLPTSGRRLAYARWLTSGRHPLVARVLANRVWLHHFGRGIVDTPDDFGVLGQRPSHPELLDWLAAELMDNGWSLKKLHKTIMTSTVYRQSSQASPDKLAIDPDNTLYWKWPVQRLDAEVVRDRILSASGTLSERLHGPPVDVKADDAGQIVVAGDESRRSVYVQVKRTEPLAILRAFDAPVMETNCAKRPSSTVATQALMLMNSQFILRHARQFAERLRKEASWELPDSAAETAGADTAGMDTAGMDTAGAGAAGSETAGPWNDLLENTSPWSYGHGAWDEAESRLRFERLPHWTGSAWQGSASLPDPQLGWVFVNSSGGHPGNLSHASIRRWTAPRDGVFAITGKLSHGSENGDGVRGRLVAGGKRVVGQWVAHHGEVDTAVAEVQLTAGETLDFVVDCRTAETSDSFQWPVQIAPRADAAQDSAQNQSLAWDSAREFHGPRPPRPPLVNQIDLAWRLAYGRPPEPDESQAAAQFLREQLEQIRVSGAPAPEGDPVLLAVTNLCQVLLSSNEFLYVD